MGKRVRARMLFCNKLDRVHGTQKALLSNQSSENALAYRIAYSQMVRAARILRTIDPDYISLPQGLR